MKIAHEKEIMGRLMVSVLCVFFIVLLSSVPVTSSEVNESVYPCERPYYIETSGLTKTPLRFLLINHMFKPWPDQLYSTMFGIIFYEAGNTTITNTQTSETMQYEGEHIVISAFGHNDRIACTSGVASTAFPTPAFIIINIFCDACDN